MDVPVRPFLALDVNVYPRGLWEMFFSPPFFPSHVCLELNNTR